MNRKTTLTILLTVLIFSPLTTNAGLWSTIKSWFGGNDTVYVAPSTPPTPAEPPLTPEVLTEETTVPATPPAPTYTPPFTTTNSVSFIGGVTLQQLNLALKKLEDKLTPQIERAMESPRPRGEVSNQSSHALPDGTAGYILQSNGDDDVEWVSPASLAVTGDGTFSTTSADYYITASSTIPHPGGAILGDVLYFDGTTWTPLATSSLGISGGSSGYATVQDEASSLTQRATLNFTGAGVSCVDNAGSGRTDCTISGGGSSSESAPYEQYDPDNPPSSCAVCDEFTGGAGLAWDTTAASDLTLTYDRDALHLEGSATDLWKVLWVDPPSGGNADFTISIGYTFGQSVTSDACGIAILSGGTIASPSEIKFFGMSNYSTDGMYLQFDTDYNPAAGAGTHGSAIAAIHTNYYSKNYSQVRYVDSTREISTYWSPSGFYDVPGATATLTNDPIKIGLYVRRDADCYITFFRARTDNLTNIGE